MNADILAATVQLLRDDIDVATLCGTRVFYTTLPRKEVERMPRTAIVLTRSGRMPSAGDASYIPVGRVRLDMRAYGKTPGEAATLNLAAERALKGIRSHAVTLSEGDVLVHNAIVSAGPLDLVEPDADWPFVWSSWGVHYDERVIAA